jgi:hypothetical protein
MQEKNEKISIFFERILQIANYYGIKSINIFAKKYLGYDSSEKINRLKKENTSPSFEILNDISNKFENINPGWLLTGNGEMLKNMEEDGIISDNNSNRGIIGIGNVGNVDNRHYYSSSPEVLRAQVEEKDRLLQEKDERLREKDERLREKDEYIVELKEMIKELKK